MKRLKLEMFYDITKGAPHVTAEPDVPWKHAFTKEGGDLDRALEWHKDMNLLLGLDASTSPKWYSHQSRDNPLAELPTALAIEKINRAAESLGILED